MLQSIILYSLKKKRVCWQNQKWKSKHKARHNSILYSWNTKISKDINYSPSFLIYRTRDLTFWRKLPRKSVDVFGVLSPYLFWIYSPFSGFQLKTQNWYLLTCHQFLSYLRLVGTEIMNMEKYVLNDVLKFEYCRLFYKVRFSVVTFRGKTCALNPTIKFAYLYKLFQILKARQMLQNIFYIIVSRKKTRFVNKNWSDFKGWFCISLL